MADTQTTLTFHRSLYAPEAVRAAVEAYGAYAESASVEEGTHDIVVTLKGYDEGYGDAFGDSFANHALFETVVRARQALGS
jgi:hypothetical protein